ncbi:MAG: alpha/beta hydrolase family protein [Pirellulales bacterium]
MNSRRSFLGQLSAACAAGVAWPRESQGHLRDAAVDAAPPPPVLPLPPAAASQLGSLYPFVRSQAAQLTFPLSYLHDRFTDLAAWKAEARGRLLELLQYAPARCAPQPQVVRRSERNGYVQEELSFLTAPDVRVPASLLIPQRAQRPAPGIVALHDHGAFYLWGREKLLENEVEHTALGDFRRQYYGGRSIAAELARRGYVVLVIDMFYWGERRVLYDDDPADWRERSLAMPLDRVREFHARASQNEQFAARALLTAGLTWPGLMLWDDMRSVDYLLTRPEVDPQRIGCVGLSVGGLRSMYLAALDERIRAAVVCGWMASFPAQLQSHLRNSIGFTKLIPGLTRWLDYPDVAALAIPSPLLVINGRRDALFEPAGVQASFDKLTACYRKAGHPDRFRGTWYDTPHEFNVEMQTEAWKWLDHWLSPAS